MVVAREHLVSHLVWILLVFAYVVNVGMSLTIEQDVTQLQQEVITLKAQVADQTGLAGALRAINNLAKLGIIDVKGLGRPKEFTGKEEDFQNWPKKTEAFFAGVIKESEMMLECSDEQVTEITQELIDLDSCRLRRTGSEECIIWSSCCSRCTQHSWLSRVMRLMTLSPTCGRTPSEAWRRLPKRCDLTTGGRKRSLLRTIISPGKCSLLELQAGIERWESYLSRNEKTLNDTLDDEMKLAGLEPLAPGALENHLILKSHRFRTFEDARQEIVKCVETKFGPIIRDSKPSETGARLHSDPIGY